MKPNIITIDLNVYCTQANYALEKNMKLATVSQWVKRAKDNTANKIEILEIPELNNLVLVKRS
jgi:hypothetical protein